MVYFYLYRIAKYIVLGILKTENVIINQSCIPYLTTLHETQLYNYQAENGSVKIMYKKSITQNVNKLIITWH